jgi:ribosomal-protein-alanine N-acetyltransferase
MSDLLAEAVRRGATAVFLEVRADNPPAQRMYERFGFERIGVRRRYYDDGTDAFTMMRKLDG